MQSVWRWQLCCSDWTEPQHIRNQSQTPRAQPGYGADGAHVWWTTRGYPALSGQPLSHCRDVPWAYSWHQGLVTQKHFTIKKCIQTFLSVFKGKLRKLQIYWGNPIVWLHTVVPQQEGPGIESTEPQQQPFCVDLGVCMFSSLLIDFW